MMEPLQAPLSPLPSLSPPPVPPHTNGTIPETSLNGTAPLTNGAVPSASTFDPGIMRTFLVSLLPPIFGASSEEFEASLFGENGSGHNTEFEDHVAHFTVEGGGPLYVTKIKEDGEGTRCFISLPLCAQIKLSLRTEDSPPTFTYTLSSQLTYSSHVTIVALIKRGPTLDPLISLASQLHIINLFGDEDTPYESLHSLLSGAVKPWFEAFVGARGGGKDGDGKMGMMIIIWY